MVRGSARPKLPNVGRNNFILSSPEPIRWWKWLRCTIQGTNNSCGLLWAEVVSRLIFLQLASLKKKKKTSLSSVVYLFHQERNRHSREKFNKSNVAREDDFAVCSVYSIALGSPDLQFSRSSRHLKKKTLPWHSIIDSLWGKRTRARVWDTNLRPQKHMVRGPAAIFPLICLLIFAKSYAFFVTLAPTRFT